MNVGIIGAGISGLAAAWRLKKSGCHVTVYEAGDHAGGVIRSIRENGFLSESGPHTLMDTGDKITQSIRELGLSDQKIVANPCAKRRYIVRNRKPVVVPDSAASFLMTELFTTGAKMRLLGEPFIAPRTDAEDENLAHFVRRRLGEEILDYGVDPLVGGIYAGDPEKLSVHHAFPKIDAMEREYGSLFKGALAARKNRARNPSVESAGRTTMYSFRDGLGALPGALHARLAAEVFFNTPATSLSHDLHGWIVGCSVHGVEEHFRHDAILVTTPAWQLPKITFHGDAFRAMSLLRLIPYPPVITVTLGFNRNDVLHPLDGFGMLVPRVEGLALLGTLFTSSLFPNRAPDNHVLITNFIGGARNPSVEHKSLEALLELTLHDLRILLGVTGHPAHVHLDRHSHAIPQYEVGYGKFRGIMKRLERENPGFFMAGNFRDGTSVGQTFGSGCDAADRILTFLRANRDRALRSA